MRIDGWQYYNHAAIPTTTPCENPDITPIENNTIWQIDGGTPLLARWTTDFDCECETNWWYVIKDTPFDIASLKAKRRYEINRGIKHFDIHIIDPREYKEDLYKVQVAAFSVYPAKYRPTVHKETFFDMIDGWEKATVFGAFFGETNELVGYAQLLEENPKCIHFNVLKVMPDYEKYSINAALVAGIMYQYNDRLDDGWYICDGARSINHETGFQDYLEKYFGFRKAYCKLHIAYKPKVKWLIQLLFPFRKLLLHLDEIKKVHLLNAVLKMEGISRKEKKM